MLSQDISSFARTRLELSRMERSRFRLAPQISLEILLILASGDGSVALTEIYERIAAAEKSIRAHIRALMASGLVDEEKLSDDRRTKRLTLTSRGEADVQAYVQACGKLSLVDAI